MKAAAFGFALSLSCCAAAQQFPAKPLDNIADEANILSPQEKDQVRHDSDEFLGIHGASIVVATIPSLQAEQAGRLTLEQYTDKLFDHWRTGTKESNFSVLIVVSKGDRKSQIQMGAAWHHQMDQEGAHMMKDALAPNVEKGLYSQGIVATTDWLAKINPKSTREDPYGVPTPRRAGIFIGLTCFSMLCLAIFLWRRSYRGLSSPPARQGRDN